MNRRIRLLCALRYWLLLGAGVGGSPAAHAQYVAPAADPLARPVQLPATTAPLEDVLRALARRAGLSLSYSADRLPLRRVITVAAGPPVPLRTALVMLTRGRPIAWALLNNGLLVLWRRGDRPPRGVQPDALSMQALQTDAHRVVESARPASSATGFPRSARRPVPETARANAPLSASARWRTTVGEPTVARPAVAGGDLTENAPRSAAHRPRMDRRAAPLEKAAPLMIDALAFNISSLRLPAAADSGQRNYPARLAYVRAPLIRPASPWKRHLVQVSLVPPVSSNWVGNSYAVNRVSINLLVGYAAGVDGVELGGLMNMERDSVRGAQAAGLVNAASGPLDGVQIAGLVNLAGGPSQGWQSAGLFNRAGRAHGPDGTTSAEPLWQVSGLINSAPAGIKGAQIAGLINLASRVHGVQIAGLLNVADSVAGVSLAPLNFVWHGYHVLEITTTNSWPLNLTLKLGGSAAFYTYFTGALLPSSDSTARWGIGYGLGAELAARKRFSVSIDAQAMQVNEDDRAWATLGQALNLHNQVKVQAGWAIGRQRRLRLLIGPSLSVFVSKRRDAGTGQVTSRLISENSNLFDGSPNAQTRWGGWMEVTGGLRWKF